MKFRISKRPEISVPEQNNNGSESSEDSEGKVSNGGRSRKLPAPSSAAKSLWTSASSSKSPVQAFLTNSLRWLGSVSSAASKILVIACQRADVIDEWCSIRVLHN